MSDTRQPGSQAIPVLGELHNEAANRELPLPNLASSLAEAMALHRHGQRERAEQIYRQILRLDPHQPDALHLLGLAAYQSGQFQTAADLILQAIGASAGVAAFHNSLGIVHQAQGNADAALACYRRALVLCPSDYEAHYNLGNTLTAQGKSDEAAACFRRALELKPEFAEAHHNLGSALARHGKLDEAMSCFRRAVEIRPDYAVARWNQSMLHLLQGDFERGWPGYEWRWRTKMPRFADRGFQQPLWDGKPFDGKTILLHAEQGLGDTIQFARYARQVKARGGTVVVECQPELASLLKSCSGIDVIVGRGQLLPNFDRQVPLLSLPAIFGTDLETIPAEIPYLRTDSELEPKWQTQLPGGNLKIGITWQGSPLHARDRVRSFPLSCFAPLARVPGVRLYSLQKGPASADVKALAERLPLTDLSEQIVDFADTAAIMSQLDLVISCDSAPAHLAGALGLPIWVALPSIPDWRWLLEREDSPWYPTMRLFRQRRAGDWDEVFQRIAQALSERTQRDRPGQNLRLDTRPTTISSSQGIQQVRQTVPTPNLAEAMACHRDGQLERAGQIYRQILQLDPNHPDALNLLGLVAYQQDQHQAAADSFRRAISARPNAAAFHSNLGMVHQAQGNPEAAQACYRRALELDPASTDAQYNLGASLQKQFDVDEALACYDRALQLDPNHASAHWNQSLLHLLKGDFKQGWSEYEWRWRTKMMQPVLRGFKQPLWDGQPFAGKTILLHAEQGFGDSIQFIRYARQVKARGGTVVVECQPELARLLKSCSGIDTIVDRGEVLPSFEMHIPLLSLPGSFGTTVETIPAEIPYLRADSALLEQWRAKLSEGADFKIGIAWQGNPVHRRDRWRSFPLDCFTALARIPGVQLYSLQKGPASADVKAPACQLPVTDLSARINDFADTAAIMSRLDLVIACDSAPAHLAGALGRPVWVALPFAPDWRWLLEREDSPWYPTMRLFRQQQRGNWGHVFARIAAALEALLGRHR